MPAILINPSGVSLSFDRSEEDYAPSSIASQHAIEDGSKVSDHVQALPLPFTVTGTMSESPYSTAAAVMRSPSIARGGLKRVTDARDYLFDCQKSKLLLDVVTNKFGTISSCVLLAFTHHVAAKGEVTFDCRFQQMTIATAGVVTIPASAPRASAKGAADDGHAGAQPTTEATGDQSYLAQIYDAAFGGPR